MQLIFIHGSGGSKEAWTYQTQYFKGSMALDLPGHPAGELRPSIAGYVEWLRAFVREKGYSDLVLIGHSLGSGIALLYALMYPEEVKAVITVGGGARLRVHPMFLTALEEAVKDPAAYANTPNPAYDLIDRELAAVLKRRSAENGPAATLNDMRACDQFDIMDRIDQIDIPTLALCGDQDVMTPPKYSHYLAQHMPRSQAQIIAGGTHMVFAEKPDEVNRAIEDFLKTIAA
ncbi:MAG: alpha/beta hydrolase [Deltaproteobacteria bacterium]|nr:alpha/beta hydrolase [Deltaproteobacteria bacterium]